MSRPISGLTLVVAGGTLICHLDLVAVLLRNYLGLGLGLDLVSGLEPVLGLGLVSWLGLGSGLGVGVRVRVRVRVCL